MAASNEWTEYHLTQNGWEEGTNKTDFSMKTRLLPTGRVLTKRYEEFMGSSFSNLSCTTSELWNCGDNNKIELLIEKFGDCPQHL